MFFVSFRVPGLVFVSFRIRKFGFRIRKFVSGLVFVSFRIRTCVPDSLSYIFGCLPLVLDDRLWVGVAVNVYHLFFPAYAHIVYLGFARHKRQFAVAIRH
jgi:hypothetical protein